MLEVGFCREVVAALPDFEMDACGTQASEELDGFDHGAPGEAKLGLEFLHGKGLAGAVKRAVNEGNGLAEAEHRGSAHKHVEHCQFPFGKSAVGKRSCVFLFQRNARFFEY